MKKLSLLLILGLFIVLMFFYPGKHSPTKPNSIDNSNRLTLFQDFKGWYSGSTSPDGIWVKAFWKGGFDNIFSLDREVTQDTYNGESGGYLLLTNLANSLLSGEIQTNTAGPYFGYGYYETRMKPTSVRGVVNSFFWKEVNYLPLELDIEFFTAFPNRVFFTIHPSKQKRVVTPPSDYTTAFHRYGFLWTPGQIDYTIDGEIVASMTDPTLNTTKTGYMMMNAWSSFKEKWLQGPAPSDNTCVYDWVKFYAGATSVPQ
jgi:hypothetical protein